MVREGGVEPPHPFEYTDLNRARLPIPPLAHAFSSKLSLVAYLCWLKFGFHPFSDGIAPMAPQLENEWPLEPEFLFEFFMELDPEKRISVDAGNSPKGHRIVGTTSGGWIKGPGINATVLSAVDYPVVRPDDTLGVDMRAVAQTDDGENLYFTYVGFITPWSTIIKARMGETVDPKSIEWKVFMDFEVGSQKYDWLNRSLIVARGALAPGGFLYRAYKLN